MGGVSYMSKSGESDYTISVEEAKEILGVSRKTIYRRLRKGELKGKKYKTDNTEKWLISEDSVYSNKMINESVEVKEVNKLIDKDQLMNDLVEAINNKNKQIIEESMDKVNSTIENQQELLKKQNNKLEKMEKQLQELYQHKNKSLWQKIKELIK